MDNREISITIEKNMGIISLDNLQTKNSLTIEMLENIKTAINTLEKNKNTDIIWLKSTINGYFSSGYNLEYIGGLNEPEAKFYSHKGSDIIKTIKNCKKIVCCSINGKALGGGFEIALACDLIFATRDSEFGFPEVNYGIIPGFGGTQLLNRKLYETFSKYLIFTGNLVTAQELYEKGILNEIFEKDSESCSQISKLAELVKKRSKFAIGLAKETINNGLEMPLEQALKFEQNAFMASFASNDKKEGMTAFREKRTPVFKDRWEDFESL